MTVAHPRHASPEQPRTAGVPAGLDNVDGGHAPQKRSRLYLLLAFPPLAAFGPYASFHPYAPEYPYFYRILCAALLLPALLIFLRGDARRFFVAQLFALFTVSWVLFAPLTLRWTPDLADGWREVAGASICIFGAFVAVALSGGTEKGCAALRSGWLIAFALTSVVALWEIRSGSHLAALVGGPTRFGSGVVLTTFYNPNNYAGFLLVVVAILLPMAVMGSTATKRGGSFALTFMAAYLILLTGSRLGLLAVGLMFICVVIWISRFDPGRATVMAIATTVAGVLAGLALGVANPTSNPLGFMTSPFSQDSTAADSTRIALLKAGLRYLKESKYLGSGAGSFETLVSNDSSAALQSHITNAHNTFLELAVQYGLVVTIPLALLMFGCVYPMRERHMSVAPNSARIEIVLTLIAIVAAALDASSLVADPVWWLMIGYMTAVSWALARHMRTRLVPDVDTATADASTPATGAAGRSR